MKSPLLNGLLMATAVAAAYLPIRALPDLRKRPPASGLITYRPVTLPAVGGVMRLAGAWQVTAVDRRFTGISGLAIDQGRFLTVTDRGAVVRFDSPTAPHPHLWLADLRDGPGQWGEKWSRDAESLARDPQSRGWWVGYEQKHSLWLYDEGFGRSLASIDLRRDDWRDNRGAEGLVTEGNRLLVTAENGHDAISVSGAGIEQMPLDAGAEVAEAARAPDGSAWVLLRTKGPNGINQAIAPLTRTKAGYRAGPALPVPKGLFDNYEGMAIEAQPGGGWRFWLVTDDGHRIMARTLLVALDYVPPSRHDKSPARGAGPSQKPSVGTP